MAAHLRDLLGISIHAPYAGRDVLLQRGDKLHGISIHAPRAVRDDTGGRYTVIVDLFQSTHPSRGATAPTNLPRSITRISIHAPLAGRDRLRASRAEAGKISIHAPHAGRDLQLPDIITNNIKFQSTRLMRGATGIGRRIVAPQLISIHAPHAGRDAQELKNLVQRLNFNPRAPCGARLRCCHRSRCCSRNFNPRAPCGARLTGHNARLHAVGISIHAPHAGRDSGRYRCSWIRYHFNPRAPCGARLLVTSCICPRS